MSINSEESIEVVSTHRLTHGCSYYLLILKKVGNNLKTDVISVVCQDNSFPHYMYFN